MRHLMLAEYRTTSAVPLARAEVDALRRLVPGLAVAPTLGLEGCYDLTPGSWVGGVTAGDLAVEIRPKVPVDRLLFLLAYALDPRRWRETPFDYTGGMPLIESVIPGFVAQVRGAFRRGVLQGYRVEEAALATVRGRLRFDDQLRRHYGVAPPVEVRYDEFSEDIEPNRLIKAAIARLGRLPVRSAEARRSLRAFDGALATVQSVEYDRRRLPVIEYTRLNAHYRPAVELARLILRATAFELGHGAVRSAAFLNQSAAGIYMGCTSLELISR